MPITDIAAIFNFLSTPMGQQILSDFRALDQNIAAKLKGLFDHVHASTVKNDPPEAAK